MKLAQLSFGIACLVAAAGCRNAGDGAATTTPRSDAGSRDESVTVPAPTAPAQQGEAMGGSEGRIVEGPGYRGVIFPAEAEEGPSAPGGRWTPTEADVAVAERFVRERLPSLAASPSYQQDAVPRIVARLAEYRRQYVGLRGESGELSIWVSFFLAPEEQHPDWTRSVVLVRGGGEAYFQLTVDMDAFNCRELKINSSR